jgi:PAS domain S-box-containing protein
MLGRFTKQRGDLAARVAALDALRGNVMIADQNLNITYMNPSVMALMQEAEMDLRKELPNFHADRLIGSNIDVFHKNPSHQRRMLSALSKPHNATIRVGKWVFDLLVTPLFEGGSRIGFVVEWANAHERLLNLDYAAQMTAIGRSQAIIQFNTDGTIIDANENFLKAMGYRLEEIKGKHHSMFVEADYKNSRDYEVFWDDLRRGEARAAQFKRLGKNGKPVWIEGSYNPIFDANGKVAKVVKFATDITAQIELLGNLKSLIDKNFGEINNEIDRSMSQAGNVTSAADVAAENVQAVASGASELAASVDEIARSMVQSRDAVDSVFERAQAAEASTQRLTAAAQAMNGIVAMIQNIAGQINLLALNATIEAARAGEAGRGFAVVASEVKNLANQAARATDQISTEIDGIQNTSGQVAGALDAIRDAVKSVRELVTTTASAVEEQSAVTRGMSDNMQRVSKAVDTVSSNVGNITSAVREVAQAVNKTKEAAEVLVR